jgi:glycosyltransferase involved in cell wall biosynthesis
MTTRPNDSLPSLLVIGTPYLILENRKKIHALSLHFKTTLVLPQLQSIKSLNAKVELENQGTEKLEIISLTYLGDPEQGTRYMLYGLSSVFRSTKFDIILVESEPWALIRWQAYFLKLFFSPSSLFGEFTWENLPRPGLKGIILTWIYRLAAQTTDFVIAGNQEASALLQQAGLCSSHILVAPQIGVDSNHFKPVSVDEKKALQKTYRLPENKSIIGYAGRFSEEKGILDLIATAQELKSKGNDFCLSLMGSGELDDEIHSLARQHPWIHIIPPKPHSQVFSYLQCLDLFVLPSKISNKPGRIWKEQFGHVLIEAMSCGIPVIGSNSGAIPEVIQDQELIFEENNPKSLGKLLQHFLSNPEWLKSKAIQGKILTNEIYTHQKVAAAYHRFLTERLKK